MGETAATTPLGDILAHIEDELAAFGATIGNDPRRVGLTLDTVTVELTVAAETSAEGSVTFGVTLFGFGARLGGSGSRSETETSVMKIKLSPPEGVSTLSGPPLDRLNLAEALVSARAALLDGIAAAPTFRPKGLEVAVKFAVERAAGPKGEITVKIVEASASGAVGEASTHAITLSFAEEPL